MNNVFKILYLEIFQSLKVPLYHFILHAERFIFILQRYGYTLYLV